MINKDYILRMAEKVGRVLAIVMRLRDYDKDEEALIYIDDIFLKTVGLTSRFINSLPEETLLQSISPLGTLNIDACLWIASLLKAEGEIYESQKNTTASYYRYHKALYLFLQVILHEHVTADADLYTDVNDLLKKLEEYEIPWKTRSQLFAYYEHIGNYARAEDTLFDLLETAYEHQLALAERGRAFYTRLRVKSDQELLAGNLSREEVDEGLAQLEQRSL